MPTKKAPHLTVHVLKIWPEYFEAVKSGRKRFEVRKNDRDFRTDETVVLREYNPEKKVYTGREVTKKIGYLMAGRPFLPRETCAFQLEETGD